MRLNAPSYFRFFPVLFTLLVLAPTLCHAQGNGVILFGLTNTWKYNQTVSYDGVNWTARAFDDAALPNGRGVLAVEDANNPFVIARTNTALTIGRITYYFRKHFSFTGNLSGVSLTCSNIVDDGAVYYLNGVEINRFSMPAAPSAINYSTLATGHEAAGFDVFTLSGPAVETNLVAGDNVLAVEVHQTTAGSSDIVFGLALSASYPEMTPLPLRLPLTPPVYGYRVDDAFPGLSFGSPVAMTAPPGETNRLFIVNQAGSILVITNLASPTLTTFMNLAPQVVFSGESGLLGLAFHPGYATNRYFYVFYSTTATTTQGANSLHQRLARFQTDAANPNSAPTNSQRSLFTQADPASNHNGGDIHFGPDGLLYISLGDGGAQYDGGHNSQIISLNFFSAILRLDVDEPFRTGSLMPNPHPANTNTGTINYRIPFNNPFIGFTNFDGRAINSNQVRTEFYAVGFRNPWRFSFDSVGGQLYCGDVGQDLYEEVDVITKGGNYGWAYREASHPGYRTTNTVVGPLIDPIQEYVHTSQPGDPNYKGNAVIGGVVYRGARFPQLYGCYVFGDNSSANIWMLRYDGTNTVPFQRITSRSGVSAFGTDPSNGDVLMTDVSGGRIYRLAYDTSSSSGTPLPPTLADTGAFTNLTTITNQTQPLGASTGLVPYDINVPFWSDHARKSRWFLAATNTKIGFNADGPWTFSNGMAWMKHFDLELTNGVASSARRLETRLLVKNASGVYGITYRWGSSLTNATLVAEEGFDEPFTINDGGTMRTQIWHYPSRGECIVCHTPVGGLALGFNTAQMNRSFDNGGGDTNQLAALSAAGYFTGAISNIHSFRSLAAATNGAASLEWRVRSYLAANCAQCHQPGGAALGFWNANITNSTAHAGLIDGELNNNLGDTNNRVIAPGSLSNSVLLARISTRGPGQMPPLASSVLDNNAIQLVSAWITNGLAGYQTFAQWQAARFGSTNAPNAGSNFDADGDGASNYNEYIAGTDPLNPDETWRVSIRETNGQARLEFVQPANQAFEIQRTTTLEAPTVWKFYDVPENRPAYPATDLPISITESITNGAYNFYRVKLSAP